MPADSHPMTMFNTGILAMQGESIFRKKYDMGMKKSDYWEATLEDGVRLLAVTCSWGRAYRMRFNKGDRINPDVNKDWAGNFVHMIGLPDKDGNFS